MDMCLDLNTLDLIKDQVQEQPELIDVQEIACKVEQPAAVKQSQDDSLKEKQKIEQMRQEALKAAQPKKAEAPKQEEEDVDEDFLDDLI